MWLSPSQPLIEVNKEGKLLTSCEKCMAAEVTADDWVKGRRVTWSISVVGRTDKVSP